MQTSMHASGQGVSNAPFRPKLSVSPEAAQMAKYGDIPVGLHTGVPSVSIPLYTIKIKGYQYPITLNYHGGGIKVEDIASNVGLGFTLTATGGIFSSVNGLPDLESKGFALSASSPEYKIPDQLNAGYVGYNPDASQGDGGPLYKYATYVVNGDTDSQPDLFYYSFNGKNGKFCFDQYGQAHTVPFQPLKISWVNNSQPRFTITDEQGVQYLFEKIESTTRENPCPGSSGSASWVLTKIRLQNADSIEFHYSQVSYSYKAQLGFSRYKAISGGTVPPEDCNMSQDRMLVSSQRLERITSSSGHDITFVYENDRTDLPGTKSLGKVRIKEGERTRIYELEYGYFGSLTGDQDSRRLKLQRIKDPEGNYYTFSYKESIGIPSRMSYAQDHWGFYNGKPNQTLLPKENQYQFDGADREVDTAYSSVAILNRVQYPTGGYTALRFEPNDYWFQGNERTEEDFSVSLYSVANQTVTRSFTLDVPARVYLSYSSSKPSGGGGGIGGDEDESDAGFSLGITGSNGFSYFCAINSSVTRAAFDLAAGTYTLTNTVYGSRTAFIKAEFKKTTDQYIEKNKFAGGLRIKEIWTYPGTGNPTVKRFEYTRDGRSTGKINFFPVYTRLYTHAAVDYTFERISAYNFWHQTSTSLFPLGASQGGAVAYTEVTEYQEGGEAGKTVNRFSFERDSGGSQEDPQSPVTGYDWMNGNLLEREVFKKKGTAYLTIQKENYYHSVQQEDLFWNNHYLPNTLVSDPARRGLGLAISRHTPHVLFGTRAIQATYKVNSYRIISNWLRLDSSTVTSFNTEGSTSVPEITTRHRYLYDNMVNLQKTEDRETSSRSGEVVTQYKYPHSSGLTSSQPALIALQSAYRINEVLETEKVNGQGREKTVILFKDWGNGILQPEMLLTAQNAEQPEVRIRYLGYDGRGNLKSQSQANGPLFSYQWGYNKQYPTSEVKNATESEFYSENFEETAGATAGAAHTGKKYYSGSYTVSWPVPNSRSYVLSYWYRQGGIWKYSGQQPYSGPVTLSTGDAFDDIRIHPSDAWMTTYTYEPLTGMSSSTDEKGNTVYYQYDSFGRLQYIKDRSGAILKDCTYHYKP
ncbi:RHS repeat domain-containing protein [Pararcticibacter amylolyticus]|nr:hypothetical protein [Pararcticibacter amylolyticus]